MTVTTLKMVFSLRAGVEVSAAKRPDWPRNGAILKGVVHDIKTPVQGCTKWLEVGEYKQNGGSEFIATPHCWMQFDQGGLLLHKL